MQKSNSLQFITKIVYPVCREKITVMAQSIINDNMNQSPKNKGFSSGIYLGSRDIALLVFVSLVINLFSLAVPLVTLQVYDRILSFQSIGTLQVLCSGVVVVVILDTILRLCRSVLIGWASACFEHDAFTSSLKHLMSIKLRDVQKFSHGQQLQRLSAISKLKNFYSGQALINIVDLPFVLIFIGFIAYLGKSLVIVPIVLLGLFAVYAYVLGKHMKHVLEKKDVHEDRRINFISETLDKIHTVKMLGLECALLRRSEEMQNQNIVDAHRLNAQNMQSQNAASLFTQIMMVSMISMGAYMVIDGQMSMGVLIACVLLSGRIMQPVQRALSFWSNFQEYQLAKKKMEALLSCPEQTKVKKSALKVPKGKLEMKGLSFSYEEGEDATILNDVNLSLPPGTAISLVGAPGDGKTTLMKLIAGIYEPTGGKIMVDGVETCQYPFEDIAKYIGYLPPDSEIFQGSVMDNITSFRPDMEDQAIEIAGYLGIDTVVSKLAQGYNTHLFDGPADPITPGMKQRITLARVLINRPRILLFDYADKSLDKDGYNHLFKFLGQIKGQASMVLVSNDRNILHLAQAEYMIEDGKLVMVEESFEHAAQPFKELKL